MLCPMRNADAQISKQSTTFSAKPVASTNAPKISNPLSPTKVFNIIHYRPEDFFPKKSYFPHNRYLGMLLTKLHKPCARTAQRNSRGTPKAPYIRNNAGQPYFMRIIGDAKSPRSVPATNQEQNSIPYHRTMRANNESLWLCARVLELFYNPLPLKRSLAEGYKLYTA